MTRRIRGDDEDSKFSEGSRDIDPSENLSVKDDDREDVIYLI